MWIEVCQSQTPLRVCLCGANRTHSEWGCLIGRLGRQKAAVVPTYNLWFKYKPGGTNWKQTNCCWEKTRAMHIVSCTHSNTHSLSLAYFWCLPMPSLVVCERVKVDKVCLGLWSGWAEHQTVLPSLHLFHLNTKTTYRHDEEEHWERKHKRKMMIISLLTLCWNDVGKRITWFSVTLTQLYVSHCSVFTLWWCVASFFLLHSLSIFLHHLNALQWLICSIC